MSEGSNSFDPRGMLGPGSSVLNYNIYLDATHRDGLGHRRGHHRGLYRFEPAEQDTPVIVPAYGRIFGGQDVPAGPYGDNVPVRILF